jgi:hypothetical protein
MPYNTTKITKIQPLIFYSFLSRKNKIREIVVGCEEWGVLWKKKNKKNKIKTIIVPRESEHIMVEKEYSLKKKRIYTLKVFFDQLYVHPLHFRYF